MESQYSVIVSRYSPWCLFRPLFSENHWCFSCNSFMLISCLSQDFAFSLEGDGFKWRWETNLVGAKLSAKLLSQHLIMPLISSIHIAFTSPEPLADMARNEIEKVCSLSAPFFAQPSPTHEITNIFGNFCPYSRHLRIIYHSLLSCFLKGRPWTGLVGPHAEPLRRICKTRSHVPK